MTQNYDKNEKQNIQMLLFDHIYFYFMKAII